MIRDELLADVPPGPVAWCDLAYNPRRVLVSPLDTHFTSRLSVVHGLRDHLCRSRDAIWQYTSQTDVTPQRLDGRSVLPGSYVHVPRARYTFGASTYH